jgi:hypothetical protein
MFDVSRMHRPQAATSALLNAAVCVCIFRRIRELLTSAKNRDGLRTHTAYDNAIVSLSAYAIVAAAAPSQRSLEARTAPPPRGTASASLASLSQFFALLGINVRWRWVEC